MKNLWISREEVENNPEFWEEVVDYEILELKSPFGPIPVRTHKMLNNFSKYRERGYEIKSIKRLSDGEVFTVGDIIMRNGWCDNKLIVAITMADDGLRFHSKSEVSYLESKACPTYSQLEHLLQLTLIV